LHYKIQQKLFTSCIAHQLENWMINNNLLYGNQKSLSEFEGCSEYNLALNLLIEENKRMLKSTYITFLDIANAFPSVPIETIDGILERHNVNKKTINIIKELNRNCSTTYHVGNLTIGPITVHKGVRQGCPLSMLLFNVAINQVLISIQPKMEPNNHMNNFKILAYADDIAIVNNNLEELQKDVTKANEVIECLGMKVKPSKCALLVVNPAQRKCGRRLFKQNPKIFVSETEIEVINDDTKKYKYLGILRGTKIEKIGIISMENIQKWSKT